MKEYRIESFKKEKEAEMFMNQMAKEGWEVKAVFSREMTISNDIVVTVEREKH